MVAWSVRRIVFQSCRYHHLHHHHVREWVVEQQKQALNGGIKYVQTSQKGLVTRAGSPEFRDDVSDGTDQRNRINQSSKRPPMFLYGKHAGDDCVQSPLGMVQNGDRVMLSSDESRHARTVLRLAHGSTVQLCDGHGAVVAGQVEYDVPEVDLMPSRGGKKRNRTKGSSGSQQHVYIRVVEDPVMHDMPKKQWHVAVACGSLKGGRADWLIEKCAEVGATRFTPLLTLRSPDMKREADRWERLAVSVMKQSLQPYKMEICAPCNLDVLLESCSDSCAYVGAEGAPVAFGSALENHVENKENVLIIGPEGDFTPEELEFMMGKGVIPVTMGNRRLRTETAAIAMLSYATIHTKT